MCTAAEATEEGSWDFAVAERNGRTFTSPALTNTHHFLPLYRNPFAQNVCGMGIALAKRSVRERLHVLYTQRSTTCAQHSHLHKWRSRHYWRGLRIHPISTKIAGGCLCEPAAENLQSYGIRSRCSPPAIPCIDLRSSMLHFRYTLNTRRWCWFSQANRFYMIEASWGGHTAEATVFFLHYKVSEHGQVLISWKVFHNFALIASFAQRTFFCLFFFFCFCSWY